MRIPALLVCAAALLVVTPLSAAEPPAPRHLIVLNKPGPRFADHVHRRDAVVAHRKLYVELAEAGDLLVGGRIDGVDPYGMSVFRIGVDAEALRRRLEADPIVQAGILALEFRHWELHMGSLGPRAEAGKGTSGM